MPNIGPLEIVGLLILALLLFGAKRLPEIGRSLGSGMREFKDSVSGNGKSDDHDHDHDHPHAELPVGTTQDTTAHSPSRENDPVH